MLAALPGYYFDQIVTDENPCPACPPNCKVDTKNFTMYARPEKTSETDIPILMNVRRLICDGSTSTPVPVCQRELEKLKK